MGVGGGQSLQGLGIRVELESWAGQLGGAGWKVPPPGACLALGPYLERWLWVNRSNPEAFTDLLN